MSANNDKRFKDQFDRIIGRFYQSYALRWSEQELTGKIELTLNFFKGALGHPNLGEEILLSKSAGSINDREVAKIENLENGVKFSELK